MGFAQCETEIADRAARYLKVELKRAGVTYRQLADCLKDHGLHDETEHSIKAKLKRGTFPATFFLATVAALGLETVAMAQI
jgi:2-hydroxychromene-2-carboxylate isomerase